MIIKVYWSSVLDSCCQFHIDLACGNKRNTRKLRLRICICNGLSIRYRECLAKPAESKGLPRGPGSWQPTENRMPRPLLVWLALRLDVLHLISLTGPVLFQLWLALAVQT